MTSQQLSGRVIAVTGAGRGLGLTITETLLSAGARVIANYNRSKDDLDELVERYPDRLTLCPGDIGDEATSEAMRQQAREIGRMDVLVHNAGIARDGLLVQMSADDWDEVIRVNLRGAFLATKHAIKVMMRQRYGRILYISSLSAMEGNAGQAAYAASKAGMEGLARTVAQEYPRYGIRSAVLALGIVNGGLALDLDPEILETKVSRTLLGTIPPERVAETVAFLSSAAADHINSTVVRMDGGMRF